MKYRNDAVAWMAVNVQVKAYDAPLVIDAAGQVPLRGSSGSGEFGVVRAADLTVGRTGLREALRALDALRFVLDRAAVRDLLLGAPVAAAGRGGGVAVGEGGGRGEQGNRDGDGTGGGESELSRACDPPGGEESWREPDSNLLEPSDN